MIKIGLDAGHGLKTAGKQTPNGIKEWTLNDKVRDKVVKNLSDYECEIIHLDNNEGKVDEELSARVAKYMKAGCSVVVSIHHNAYKNKWGKHTGVEVFVDRGPTKSDKKLAECVYKRLVEYTGLEGRGIKEYNFYVINQDRIPAILCEGGFMDSKIDYEVITSDAGQTAYAKAVAEGLIEFCKLKKKKKTTKPAATKPSTETTNKTTTKKKKETCAVELNVLRKGSKGSDVKALQALLIGYGYSCGSAGVDGSFGPSTHTALTKYQKAKGLAVDGVAGPKTWKKLLGV